MPPKKLTRQTAGGAGQLHLMLAGHAALDEGGCTVLALDDAGSVRIAWSGSIAVASLEPVALDDPVLLDVWGPALSRLTLTLRDPARGRAAVQIAELVPEGHR